MITRELITALYKKYPRRADSVDMLNLALLFESTSELHDIHIDADSETLMIGSIAPNSPFHQLQLQHLHAIVEIEDWVAIVMHSTILFLSCKDSSTAVDIKPVNVSVPEYMS